MTAGYDIAVIGGGIMGCATALRMAEGDMRAIVLDQGDLGQGASGSNAGTLSLQIKRVKLMPYALKGHHEWEAMGESVAFEKLVAIRWPSLNASQNFCMNAKLLKPRRERPLNLFLTTTFATQNLI